jgi:hypothetical protein
MCAGADRATIANAERQMGRGSVTSIVFSSSFENPSHPNTSDRRHQMLANQASRCIDQLRTHRYWGVPDPADRHSSFVFAVRAEPFGSTPESTLGESRSLRTCSGV